MVYKDLLLLVPQAARISSGILSQGLWWRKIIWSGRGGGGTASRTFLGAILVMQSLSIIFPFLSDIQFITKINNYFSFTHILIILVSPTYIPLNIYLCYNVTSD